MQYLVGGSGCKRVLFMLPAHVAVPLSIYMRLVATLRFASPHQVKLECEMLHRSRGKRQIKAVLWDECTEEEKNNRALQEYMRMAT